jgi:hypothetical protein
MELNSWGFISQKLLRRDASLCLTRKGKHKSTTHISSKSTLLGRWFKIGIERGP